MLDMKFVRENPELVMDAMRKRNSNVNLDEFLELEKKRREVGNTIHKGVLRDAAKLVRDGKI